MDPEIGVVDSCMDPLLAPCEGGLATGMDLSLDPVMEEIRRARHEALPGLSRGAWERADPSPGWQWVERCTREVLIRRSKDLQVALWHVEALLHLQGFRGLGQGLALMTGLVGRFWDGLHPGREEPEARVQRLLGMDRHLVPALRNLPLIQGIRWEEWEACQRQPGEEGERARQALLKRLEPSGVAGAHLPLHQAREALRGFIETLEQRFPEGEAPVPVGLVQALDDWMGLLAKVGGAPASRTAATGDREGAGAPEGPPGEVMNGDRHQVVARLRESAAWFRAHEPHSPVGPLVARAARWADMPLEVWLVDVVKDPDVLAQVRELLALPGDSG